MQDTIDVLSDSDLLRDHQAGLQAIADGDVLDEIALAELMRSVGRLAE